MVEGEEGEEVEEEVVVVVVVVLLSWCRQLELEDLKLEERLTRVNNEPRFLVMELLQPCQDIVHSPSCASYTTVPPTLPAITKVIILSYCNLSAFPCWSNELQRPPSTKVVSSRHRRVVVVEKERAYISFSKSRSLSAKKNKETKKYGLGCAEHSRYYYVRVLKFLARYVITSSLTSL